MHNGSPSDVATRPALGPRVLGQSRSTSLPLFATLLLLAALAALLVAILIPFSVPMPDYWSDARQLLLTGQIQQHFTPSGYPAELALGMRLLPRRPVLGVELLQAILQIATVATAWRIIRELGASITLAFAGALTLAVHPELLATVVKGWDVNLSTLLLLLLLASSLLILKRGATPAHAALLGAIWAVGIFDRPNYLALLPALLLIFWRASPDNRRAAGLFLAAATLLLVAAATYSTLSRAVYRTLVFPGNGPYNLYAGQNAFTERTLLEHLNAETAINAALEAAHMPAAAANPHDLTLRPYFIEAAVAFATSHPATELRLVGLKLFTLLRADNKLHPIGTSEGQLELAMVLPIPVWLFLLAWSRTHSHPWFGADTLVCLLALLYTAPFLVTNSDPRFRMPLDALAIVHSAALLSRARDTRTSPAVPV